MLWLRLALPYRLDHVNIYLLEEADGFAVLDAGLGDDATREVWQAVLQGPLAGRRLTRMIVTHFHPDHVGSAGWLCETYGLPLHMPRNEYLLSLVLQYGQADRGAAMFRQFYERHGLAEEIVARVLTNGHEYLHRTTGLPSSYHRLQHGQTLTIGRNEYRVLTGGGHSIEQAMLHDPAAGLFFSADQVIAQISPNISVQPIEPQDNALGAYLAALASLIETVPNTVLVLPGHGLPFRGLHQRALALIEHHAARCAEIAQACTAAPRSAAELIPTVFRRELDAHQTGFAFGEVLAHINHMVVEGTLRRVDDGGPIDRFISA